MLPLSLPTVIATVISILTYIILPTATQELFIHPVFILLLLKMKQPKNSPIRECSESFNDWLEFTISWTPSTKVLMRIIKFPLLWVQNSIPINCIGEDISAMSNPANYNNKSIILQLKVMWCLQMGTVLTGIYNPWVGSKHINVAKPM